MSAHGEIGLSKDDKILLQNLHATWPLSIMPDAVKPFAELLRITKPAGVFMFYLPCLYGTFLVGVLNEGQSLYRVLGANAHLLLLSFLLRGGLCTWNDILDRDFDRQVKRTRIRALARNAVSLKDAYIFLAAQTVLIWLCFRSLPAGCLAYASPFLALHLGYPFAKRFTDFPQLVLGFAHSSGIFVSFPALEKTIPVFQWKYDSTLWSVCGLASAIVFWTLLNDTIYSAQDTSDDKLAGIGSTMVYWGESARNFLRVLAVLTIASLAVLSHTLGYFSPTGILYTMLTCGGTTAGLFLMVERVDLEDPVSCGWWFNNGNVMVGLAIASGLIGAYLSQL